MKYHSWLIRIDKTGAHIKTRPMKNKWTVKKAYPEDKYTILRKIRPSDLPF